MCGYVTAVQRNILPPPPPPPPLPYVMAETPDSSGTSVRVFQSTSRRSFKFPSYVEASKTVKYLPFQFVFLWSLYLLPRVNEIGSFALVLVRSAQFILFIKEYQNCASTNRIFAGCNCKNTIILNAMNLFPKSLL
jgi:hypothetical protein